MIREWGITQITPGHHPAEWRQPSEQGAVLCIALVGCTVHKGHLAAAAAIAAHDGVQRVTAQVHAQGGSIAAATVGTLLHAFHRSKINRAVPGTSSRAWFGPSANPGRRPARKWWTPLGRGTCRNSSDSVSRKMTSGRQPNSRMWTAYCWTPVIHG